MTDTPSPDSLSLEFDSSGRVVNLFVHADGQAIIDEVPECLAAAYAVVDAESRHGGWTEIDTELHALADLTGSR